MKMTKTGTENGFRVIRDGTWEPMRQHIEVKSKMFQFDQTKGRARAGAKRKAERDTKKQPPAERQFWPGADHSRSYETKPYIS